MEKQFGSSSKKWNMDLAYDLAIPLLGIHGVWFLYDIFHNKKENENKNKISFARLVLQNKVQVPQLPAFCSPPPLHNLAPIYLTSLISNILHTMQTHTAVLQRLILTLSRSVRVCTAQHLLLPLLDYPLPSPGMWAKISLAGPSSMPALRQTSPLFTLLLQPLYHSTSATLRWFNYASLFPTGQPENS